MKTVNMHDAKTHLSRLVEDASKGEPFIIARAGKPLVKVIPIGEPVMRRVGFLEGQAVVPKDFDTQFADEMVSEFYESDIEPKI